jgi:hypothetical protein
MKFMYQQPEYPEHRLVTIYDSSDGAIFGFNACENDLCSYVNPVSDTEVIPYNILHDNIKRRIYNIFPETTLANWYEIGGVYPLEVKWLGSSNPRFARDMAL